MSSAESEMGSGWVNGLGEWSLEKMSWGTGEHPDPERCGKYAWLLRAHWSSDPCIYSAANKMPRKIVRNS